MSLESLEIRHSAGADIVQMLQYSTETRIHQALFGGDLAGILKVSDRHSGTCQGGSGDVQTQGWTIGGLRTSGVQTQNLLAGEQLLSATCQHPGHHPNRADGGGPSSVLLLRAPALGSGGGASPL